MPIDVIPEAIHADQQVSVLPEVDLAPVPQRRESDTSIQDDKVGLETPPEYLEKEKGEFLIDDTVEKIEQQNISLKEGESQDNDFLETNRIIRTGKDVSEYLLSDRDDGDPSITFRAVILGLAGSAFTSTLYQLYLFKPTQVTITGTFLIVIIYTLGNLWAKFLPSGPRLRKRWGETPQSSTKRTLLKIVHFINPGPFGLKEHAVAAITASSASNGAGALSPFAAQKLYYAVPLTAGNVIMSTISISLFGYGLTGLLRPIIIAPSSMVYWSNIGQIQLFQRLHWDKLSQSRPLRWFWYSFGFMTLYELIPAYMWPMLVGFSIPCLASQNAPVSIQQTLTNVFGGSVANEGLGLFSFCFDWQYIQSIQVSLPLIQQANSWLGLFFCYWIMAALYYSNAFGAINLPFFSTSLWSEDSTKYPFQKVFVNGILDRQALAKYGTPKITATFAWGMFVGNAAVGALIAHVILFWGPKIRENIREAKTGEYSDRHQRAMQKYKEVHWLWYAGVLIIAFILGLIANLREATTLPWYAYIISLLVGTILAPFSAILYGMFGNGVATNLLCKMIGGAITPGRPLAVLYFNAWSHTTVAQAINLASDLKEGVYLKIPPFVMFGTQIFGTILGSFINYAIMISILDSQREILLSANGSDLWSGQYFNALNTQATVWSLSKEMYSAGKPYLIVPLGLVVGFLAAILHRILVKFKPKIWKLDLNDINLAVVFMYSGWFAYNQTQTSIMFTTIILGIYVQYYIRNYKPKLFKKFSYIVQAGLDGGSLLTIFILSFAVFGAAGPQRPFPSWWGNPATGYTDHCPDPSS